MNSAPGAADALEDAEGDRGELRQPFRELLEDAVAHSGDGPPRIRASAVWDRDRWRVSVADEGSGVDFEDADRDFERFESVDGSNGKQSGIGLASCKLIVERHGSDGRVNSGRGDGSTFSFAPPGVGDGGE